MNKNLLIWMFVLFGLVGMVSAYNFNPLYDASNNGATITNNGADFKNPGYEFIKDNSDVMTINGNNMTYVMNFTIACTVKQNSTTGDCFAKRTGANTRVELTLGTTIYFTTSTGAASDDLSVANPFAVNTEYTAVATCIGTNKSIYVNGYFLTSKIASCQSSFNFESIPFIGTNSGSGQLFNGTIYDIRVWNKGLTASEVTAYNNSQTNISNSNLLFWFRPINDTYLFPDNNRDFTLTQNTDIGTILPVDSTTFTPNTNGIYLDCHNNKFMIRNETWYNGDVGITGYQIRNCNINTTGQFLSQSKGIITGIGDNLRFENISIRGTYAGITVGGSTNKPINVTILSSNISSNWGNLANMMVYSCDGLYVYNSHFDYGLNWSGGSEQLNHGIYFSDPSLGKGCHNLIIENVTTNYNVGQGIHSNTLVNELHQNWSIKNLTTIGNTAAGLDFNGVYNVTLTNSLIKDGLVTGLAIGAGDYGTVTLSRNLLIKDNNFTGNSQRDVRVSGSSLTNLFINNSYSPGIDLNFLLTNGYSNNVSFYESSPIRMGDGAADYWFLKDFTGVGNFSIVNSVLNIYNATSPNNDVKNLTSGLVIETDFVNTSVLLNDAYYLSWGNYYISNLSANIVAPSNSSYMSPLNITVFGYAFNDSNSGKLFLDGVLNASIASLPSLAYWSNTISLASGSHNVVFQFCDTFSTCVNSSAVYFTISDPIVDILTITSPVNGSLIYVDLLNVSWSNSNTTFVYPNSYKVFIDNALWITQSAFDVSHINTTPASTTSTVPVLAYNITTNMPIHYLNVTSFVGACVSPDKGYLNAYLHLTNGTVLSTSTSQGCFVQTKQLSFDYNYNSSYLELYYYRNPAVQPYTITSFDWVSRRIDYNVSSIHYWLGNDVGLHSLNVSAYSSGSIFLYSSPLSYFNDSYNALLNVSVVSYSGFKPYFTANLSGRLLSGMGSVLFPVTYPGSYVLRVNASGYNINVSSIATTSIYDYFNLSLLPYNSINVSIRSESSGGGIYSSPNTSIYLVSEFGDVRATSLNGTGILSNLTTGYWTLTFSKINYSDRSYYINVLDNSFDYLYVYLNNGTQVLFNFKTAGGTELSGVTFKVYTPINGSQVLVESQLSDISGKVSVVLEPNKYYYFTAVKEGYQNYSFSLYPVLFTSYDVVLNTASSGSIIIPSANVYISPTSFFRYQNVNMNLRFTSPYGSLSDYYYVVGYPSGNLSGGGVTARGESFNLSFNIGDSQRGDYVFVYYNYTLNNGVFFEQSLAYPIVFTLSNRTWANMGNNINATTGQDSLTGYFLGDRVIIVTFISIVLFGVGWLAFSSASVGLVLVLFNILFFVGAGFVPKPLYYIVIFFTVIFLISKGSDQ